MKNTEYLPLSQALTELRGASGAAEVEEVRVKYLGREGVVTKDLRTLHTLEPKQRKTQGQAYNQARQAIEAAVAEAKDRVVAKEVNAQISAVSMDLTAPADTSGWGHAHPVLAIIDDIVRVFWQMGYQVVDGPEIENQWYNFEALNIPPDHPARDMQDTFYLTDGNLPRTHTSNLQIRYMENHEPPIRIIVPGRVYRNEDEDASHSWMFHQVEGLVVDKGISLSDLKGTLLAMMQGILGPETQVKLLPNYFPYTEPSVEMHATCPVCKGKGCKTCSHTGWLELGGAGMVHPQVLRNGGIDPEVYSGFAFGFGPERIAMIKHDVADIREFWRPDLRFLEQF